MDDVSTELKIPGALFKRIQEQAAKDRVGTDELIIKALMGHFPAPLDRDFSFGMPKKTRKE